MVVGLGGQLTGRWTYLVFFTVVGSVVNPFPASSPEERREGGPLQAEDFKRSNVINERDSF